MVVFLLLIQLQIKKYNTPNTLLAGTPAIEKKHNVIKSTNGDIQFIEK